MTALPYRVEKPWGHELIWARMIERPMSQGAAFHIEPKVIHQFEAVVPTDLLEASTPEIDDVVRLKDRYGRV